MRNVLGSGPLSCSPAVLLFIHTPIRGCEVQTPRLTSESIHGYIRRKLRSQRPGCVQSHRAAGAGPGWGPRPPPQGPGPSQCPPHHLRAAFSWKGQSPTGRQVPFSKSPLNGDRGRQRGDSPLWRSGSYLGWNRLSSAHCWLWLSPPPCQMSLGASPAVSLQARAGCSAALPPRAGISHPGK